MGEKKTRRLSFALTDDDYARLKRRADELRLPVAWLIRQAILAYLDEVAAKAPGQMLTVFILGLCLALALALICCLVLRTICWVHWMNSMYWFHRSILLRSELVIAALALRGDYHAAVQMTDMPALHEVLGLEDDAFVNLSVFQADGAGGCCPQGREASEFMLRLATRLIDDKASEARVKQ